MKRWNLPIALYVLLVFVSGGVVGALGYRIYNPPSARSNAPRLTPEQWRRQNMNEMQQRLALDADQMQKLNAIYDETDSRFRAAREKHNQVVKQIREEHVSKVKELLTSDQIPKYEQMRAEREQRAKANKH